MCRCKYPKSIKKNGITIMQDGEGERCYKTSFKLGEEGSNILVISRAPKVLEEDSCNSIYKRIVKFLERNQEEFKGIKEVNIVNLFTVYEYDKEELYNDFLLNGKEYVEGNDQDLYNDKIMAQSIREADYIIAAWGEPLEGLESLYSSRVELVLRSLRHEVMNAYNKKHILKVGEASKKGYPKHCFAWAYNDKIEKLFE